MRSDTIKLGDARAPHRSLLKACGVTDYLSYAYPQDLATYHPNCGPGGNTWRCVGISNMVQSASDMDLAIGPNTTRLFERTVKLTIPGGTAGLPSRVETPIDAAISLGFERHGTRARRGPCRPRCRSSPPA